MFIFETEKDELVLIQGSNLLGFDKENNECDTHV